MRNKGVSLTLWDIRNVHDAKPEGNSRISDVNRRNTVNTYFAPVVSRVAFEPPPRNTGPLKAGFYAALA